LVIGLRIIKDGEVLEESDNLHVIYERLLWYDRKVKDIEIRVAKYK
jgi:hypothetical protein|tara:strand:+ start:523 stop:660 length:138 start_codon:yes stop_codon:yes gene_type:complete